jgi:hypothetical protein
MEAAMDRWIVNSSTISYSAGNHEATNITMGSESNENQYLVEQ